MSIAANSSFPSISWRCIILQSSQIRKEILSRLFVIGKAFITAASTPPGRINRLRSPTLQITKAWRAVFQFTQRSVILAQKLYECFCRIDSSLAVLVRSTLMRVSSEHPHEDVFSDQFPRTPFRILRCGGTSRMRKRGPRIGERLVAAGTLMVHPHQ